MLEKLNDMFRSFTGRDDIVLTMDTEITASLGMSSFGIVQLICALEDEFDIEISNSEIKNFKKVSDIVDFLNKKVVED